MYTARMRTRSAQLIGILPATKIVSQLNHRSTYFKCYGGQRNELDIYRTDLTGCCSGAEMLSTTHWSLRAIDPFSTECTTPSTTCPQSSTCCVQTTFPTVVYVLLLERNRYLHHHYSVNDLRPFSDTVHDLIMNSQRVVYFLRQSGVSICHSPVVVFK